MVGENKALKTGEVITFEANPSKSFPLKAQIEESHEIKFDEFVNWADVKPVPPALVLCPEVSVFQYEFVMVEFELPTNPPIAQTLPLPDTKPVE